jgi:hypothetical protein
MTQREIAERAIRAALTLRSTRHVGLSDALCPYDLAERLGVEVRFAEIPSLEGMYVNRDEPLVLLGAHRPRGRQAFTCAHELGHHHFGHGTRIDELRERDSPRAYDPDEYAADCFAAFLLMPKTTVLSGLRLRGGCPREPSAAAIYATASWLGVGFSTLVTHLCASLRVIDASRAEALRRTDLRQLRSNFVGRDVAADIVVVDRHWVGRPIDVTTDQLVVVPPSARLESDHLREVWRDEERAVLAPLRPGIDRVTCTGSSWASFVRVTRERYVGRSAFRHLEDPEYDGRTDSR